jgi:hypothetical protein
MDNISSVLISDILHRVKERETGREWAAVRNFKPN